MDVYRVREVWTRDESCFSEDRPIRKDIGGFFVFRGHQQHKPGGFDFTFLNVTEN